ncbi:hypothetical protein DFJ77DRAFT_464317 [Powellomyces hirtus]|nr:hypothetical protein DFJ77DRAFT_464317 [Powellomyces hirtus]
MASEETPFHQNVQTTNVLANFLIGASVSLVASCLSSLGVNMQASSLKHNREQNLVVNDTAGVSSPVLTADNRQKYGTVPTEPLPISPIESSAERGGTSKLDGVPKPEVIAPRTSTASLDGASDSSRLSSGPINRLRGAMGDTETWTQLWRKWQWHLGFSLYLICQLFGSVIALGFVSPVVLAPLGSASLIFNVIFSRLFLGTRITRNDWLGTFFVVVGCAIVSTFGSSAPEKKQTLDDLILLFSRPAFIIYFSVQGLLVLVVFTLIKYLEYGIDALKFFTIVRQKSTAETTPLLSRRDSSLEVAKVKSDWLGALYGALGGTVASETLLLTKSGVELLIVSIFETDNQFRGAFSLTLLAALCFTVFLQLYSLNRGMHYSLPTIIVPIFYTFYTILSLFNTLVYLDQFDDYKVPDLVCIAVGMAAIIGGVVLLARGHSDDLTEEKEAEEEFDTGGSSESLDSVR